MKAGPELLTRGQVCERLGISRWTLSRWVKAQTLPKPSLTKGRTARWSREQIDAIHMQVFRERGKRNYFTKARQAKHDRAQQLAAMPTGAIQ